MNKRPSATNLGNSLNQISICNTLVENLKQQYLLSDRIFENSKQRMISSTHESPLEYLPEIKEKIKKKTKEKKEDNRQEYRKLVINTARSAIMQSSYSPIFNRKNDQTLSKESQKSQSGFLPFIKVEEKEQPENAEKSPNQSQFKNYSSNKKFNNIPSIKKNFKFGNQVEDGSQSARDNFQSKLQLKNSESLKQKKKDNQKSSLHCMYKSTTVKPKQDQEKDSIDRYQICIPKKKRTFSHDFTSGSPEPQQLQKMHIQKLATLQFEHQKGKMQCVDLLTSQQRYQIAKSQIESQKIKDKKKKVQESILEQLCEYDENKERIKKIIERFE